MKVILCCVKKVSIRFFSTSSLTNVRVRFAPSPTGSMHLGGFRTALFNYLFAKQNSGKFILRIEDTDQQRYQHGSIEDLHAILHWSGIAYDEGPQTEGKYGPYIQTERLDIYRNYSTMLIEKGLAYPCFCSPIARHVRKQNILHEKCTCGDIHPEQAIKAISETKNIKNNENSFAVRFRLPRNDHELKWNDLIRGPITTNLNCLNDFVLIKRDGFPTYHFANVVDDYLMKISHVIRGEEWISSTAKHVLLYKSFGWMSPIFCHLPLLLASNGGKLSKRSQDAPMLNYIGKYLPEAMINFVALLGWGPASENTEIFSLKTLIGDFVLENVGKSGICVNIKKLNYFNGIHLQKIMDQDISMVINIAQEKLRKKHGELWNKYSLDYIGKAFMLYYGRANLLDELVAKTAYFFQKPDFESIESQCMRKKIMKNISIIQVQNALTILLDMFHQPTTKWISIYVSDIVNEWSRICDLPRRSAFLVIRFLVSANNRGPSISDILVILGKDLVTKRLQNNTTFLLMDGEKQKIRHIKKQLST